MSQPQNPNKAQPRGQQSPANKAQATTPSKAPAVPVVQPTPIGDAPDAEVVTPTEPTRSPTERGGCDAIQVTAAFVGVYKQGDVIPADAVDDPQWLVDTGHAVWTETEPTVKVKLPAKPQDEGEAAQQNAHLRRQVSAQASDLSAAQREAEEARAAAAAAEQKLADAEAERKRREETEAALREELEATKARLHAAGHK